MENTKKRPIRVQCLRKFFFLPEKTFLRVGQKKKSVFLFVIPSEGLKNLKNGVVCKKNKASVTINEKYVLHLPVH